jgi:DNA-binding transcriptional MerR regulator
MSPRTLRYYEELGFVKPARSAGGHRLFSDEDVETLERIARMQAVGLSLKTISRALRYRAHRDERTGQRVFDAQTYETLAAGARADAAALRLRLIELQREAETARREMEGLEHDAAFFERRLRERQAADLSRDQR